MSYERVVTKDGSITYRNLAIDETMHSLSGAKEEAQKKYVEALGIAQYAKVSILDVGFGLGYNTAAALDIFLSKKGAITVVALEKDAAVFDLIFQTDASFVSYSLIKKVASAKDHRHIEKNCDVSIILGDATKTLPKLQSIFDLCFFDPYSPPKNPELWTGTFFKRVFDKLVPKGKLATYSCARHVRENLLTAGFLVSDGPIVGRRGPSTIAVKP